jgi:hypothetical protein
VKRAPLGPSLGKAIRADRPSKMSKAMLDGRRLRGAIILSPIEMQPPSLDRLDGPRDKVVHRRGASLAKGRFGEMSGPGDGAREAPLDNRVVCNTFVPAPVLKKRKTPSPRARPANSRGPIKADTRSPVVRHRAASSGSQDRTRGRV